MEGGGRGGGAALWAATSPGEGGRSALQKIFMANKEHRSQLGGRSWFKNIISMKFQFHFYLAVLPVQMVVEIALLAEAASTVGAHHLLPLVGNIGVTGQVPPS